MAHPSKTLAVVVAAAWTCLHASAASAAIPGSAISTTASVLESGGSASSGGAGQSAATVNEVTGTSPLLEYIEHTPIDVDALVARSSLPIDQVVTELTLLELAGNVESLPGGLWQRRTKGERA